MGSDLVLLSLGWILWCVLHSVLISRSLSSRLQSMLGSFQFHFRLLFNLVSCLTLLPMMVATAVLRGNVVFSWEGPWVVARCVLIAISLWLFRDGAKQYDLGFMLGTRQIRERRQQALLALGEHFSQKSSLGVTRHPWYLGSLLFLWSILPVYYQSSVIAAVVLSIYLVVGTWLEERKLLQEFGEKYCKYRQDVSMLIPVKWVVKRVRGKRKLEVFGLLSTARYRVRGWYPVKMGNGSYRCDIDHIDFWKKVNSRNWEPQTFSAFDRLLMPDTVYCDIGAWIGPTVLYAAKRCAKVYCFEPDRIAYMHLVNNIRLNNLENVLPFNLGLSAENGLSRMASTRGKRGDSMTSLLRPEGRDGMEVLCLTWESWRDLVGRPVFGTIKIDIEGGEFALLPSMSDYLKAEKPKLYLSLHPHLLQEHERVEAMSRVVEVLKVYGSCVNSSGARVALSSLLEAQAVHAAGTYLLLP